MSKVGTSWGKQGAAGFRSAVVRRGWLAALFALIGSPGAAHGQSCPPPAQSVPAPALATVSVIGTGETFAVEVTDQAVVDEMVRIAARLCRPRIVLGDVVTGNGGYNAPWSWHLGANSVALADFTTEICDARPSYVEEQLSGWAGAIYCPWGSDVIAVEPATFLAEDITVDGAVDAKDLDRLTACLAAPDALCWDGGSGCCAADIDGSRDVDCADWSLLEAAWTDSSPPSAPLACREVPAVSALGLGLLVAMLWLGALSALRVCCN